MARQAFDHPRLVSLREVRHELGRLYWQSKQGIVDPRIYGSMVRNLMAIAQLLKEERQDERKDELRAKIGELRQYLLSADPQAQLPAWVLEEDNGARTIDGEAAEQAEA